MWADRRGAFPNPIESERKSWHATSRSSPANGPIFRSPLCAAAPMGLRRAGARLLGRSLRRAARVGSPSTGSTARPAPVARARLLRDLQPPRRPGRVRPHRRAPPGHPRAEHLGRRRSRGRAPARRRRDEGHGARGGRPRREDRRRLHRLAHLACAYSFPPTPQADGTRATPTSPGAGSRSSTPSRRTACVSRSRCTRPRSPSTSPRRAARSRRSSGHPPSASTSTRPTSATRASTTSPSCASSASASSTCT